MKRSILLFWLAASIYNAFPQGLPHSHNFTIWGNLGYSNISAGIAETSVPGKIGADLGLGYEFHYKSFILQTGIDIQHLSSATIYKDFSYTVPMLDTEERSFEAVFDFESNREDHSFNNFTIPIMAGFSYSDIYFLAGGKLQFNLSSSVRTHSTVTSKARYGMIIGSDGQGLIYDMPNHGLTSIDKNINGNIDLSTIYTASIEAGKIIRPAAKRTSRNARGEYYRVLKENRDRLKPRIFSSRYYRIGFFFDYGFTSLKNKNPDQNIIINTAPQPRAYSPTLNHILYRAENIHNMYMGIKFTLVFEFKSKYPCECY